MISWFRSQCTHSEEYAKLLKRLSNVEAELDSLTLDMENMRNLARKIQKKREPKLEEEEPQDLKAQILIAE